MGGGTFAHTVFWGDRHGAGLDDGKRFERWKLAFCFCWQCQVVVFGGVAVYRAHFLERMETVFFFFFKEVFSVSLAHWEGKALSLLVDRQYRTRFFGSFGS